MKREDREMTASDGGHSGGSQSAEPAPVEGASASYERPPLGDWRRIYAVVLLELALLIVLFYLFGRIFAGSLAP